MRGFGLPFWEVCPIRRMREYFLENRLLTEEEIESLQDKALTAVADSIDYAQNHCTEPPADTLYDDIYANGERIN